MKKDYEIVPPNAAALIESLRAYGYSLNTAIADLIDNSISAHSKNIWTWFEWNGKDSRIYLVDDGHGMTETELVDAMRAGSRNPLEEREESDLGRFGLGLKTASFSQCRSLTVASKTKNTPIAVRRWDLDYVSKVNEWRLLNTPTEGSIEFLDELKDLEQGTIVLLEKLDRITGDAQATDGSARKHFLDRIGLLESHLSMVFHRFLEGSRPLKMFLNGTALEDRIKPWSPFLESNIATKPVESESKRSAKGKVSVSGFVLPHKDKLGAAEHKSASGPAGWNEQQGFYVYRNKRLLVPGSWLGLGGRGGGWTKEEHYKLARIKVDITSSLDSDWHIDVKKSTAFPPHGIRQWLEGYAKDVRKQARQVFAHRGSYRNLPVREDIVRLWKISSRAGNRVYKIDRNHPLVKSIFASNKGAKNELVSLFRMIEETVPIEKIWLDMAEHPNESNEPLGGMTEQEILKLAEQLASLLAGPNRSISINNVDLVCRMDGLSQHAELIRARFEAEGIK